MNPTILLGVLALSGIITVCLSSDRQQLLMHNGILKEFIPNLIPSSEDYFYSTSIKKTLHYSSGKFNPSVSLPDSFKMLLKTFNEFQKQSSILKDNRVKRSFDHGVLPFIGWFQQKLYGTATTSDLDDLRVASSDLSSYVKDLKKSQLEENNILIHVISNLTLTSNNLIKLSTQDNEAINKISENLYSLRLESDSNAVHIKESQYLLELTATILNDIVILIAEDMAISQGIGECKSGFLSSSLIPPDSLKKILSEISSLLRKTRYVLSLPLTKIMYYYWLPLTHCSETPEGIDIIMAIPIIQELLLTVDYFILKPVPVNIGGDYYKLAEVNHEFYYYQHTHLYGVSKYLSSCIGGANGQLSGCLVRMQLVDLLPDDGCLHLLQGSFSLSNYKERCQLTIPSETTDPWIQLNSTCWIYTGDSKQITRLDLASGKQNVIQLESENRTTIIHTKCNQLLQDEVGRRPKLTNICMPSQHDHVEYMISMYYLNLNDVIFRGPETVAPLKVIDSPAIINQSIQIIDHLQDIKKLKHLNKLIDRSVPVIEWTSPYHSIWKWVYFGCVISLSLIIGILIYRRFRNNHLIRLGLMAHVPTVASAPILEIALLTSDLVINLVIIGLICSVLLIVRAMLKKTRCHNLETEQFSRSIQHHLDIHVNLNNTYLSIGLMNLPLPGKLYIKPKELGKVQSAGNTLIISGFSTLSDLSGTDLNVNGAYPIQNCPIIPESAAFLSYH